MSTERELRYQIDIGEELRTELAPIAEQELRSLTNLVRLILWEWLAARQAKLEATA